MKILNTIAIMVIAGGMLVACDDPNQSGSSTQVSSSTTTTTTQKSEPFVWPGKSNDKGFTVASNLLRKNYLVVFDGSGSMGDESCNSRRSKYAEGRDAIIEFSKVVPSDANLGLVIFDNKGINLTVPLGTNNRSQFTQAVKDMRIGGGTPLRSSINLAYRALTKQGQRQLGYGTYAVVVVTDGEASGGQSPTNVVNALVDDTPIEVHTVGFCLSERHELNQPGRTFYASADSPEALLKGLKEVLAEAEEADVHFDEPAKP